MPYLLVGLVVFFDAATHLGPGLLQVLGQHPDQVAMLLLLEPSLGVEHRGDERRLCGHHHLVTELAQLSGRRQRKEAMQSRLRRPESLLGRDQTGVERL